MIEDYILQFTKKILVVRTFFFCLLFVLSQPGGIAIAFFTVFLLLFLLTIKNIPNPIEAGSINETETSGIHRLVGIAKCRIQLIVIGFFEQLYPKLSVF